MGKFDGKTVIVTGGVSGIGEGLTRAFLGEGARVVMNCLPGEEAGRKLHRELSGQGASCLLVEGDISRKESVERLVSQAVETYGRVHTFISNAAAFDYYQPLLETSQELWDRLMEVNLRGNFFISKAILPHFIENGGGNLIFIASIAGLIAGHGGAAYSATKHGLVGLCRQITFDYGARGVRCNTICPGSIYTPLSGPFLDRPAAREKLARTPFGTYGQPRHVAAAALYLAGDEAEFVHGATLLVDGGNLVRKWD
ncbi:MAG: SDR family oxidoreductase [Candidatus Adiutrix sp.]|jgi:3-oxoacyl-[acyl-carrier protein] reductase|nr:SDR family oxidoreductase [Candidatus Adiutrix sp.]